MSIHFSIRDFLTCGVVKKLRKVTSTFCWCNNIWLYRTNHFDCMQSIRCWHCTHAAQNRLYVTQFHISRAPSTFFQHSSTHNAQAILLVLRKFHFQVRPIVSPPPSYSKFHPYHYHYTLASGEAATNLASLNPIVESTLEHPHEWSRQQPRRSSRWPAIWQKQCHNISWMLISWRMHQTPHRNLFKDCGVYVLTPKGLHIFERFIHRNGINGDHLAHVLTTQPIWMKLLHIERRSVDDEIETGFSGCHLPYSIDDYFTLKWTTTRMLSSIPYSPPRIRYPHFSCCKWVIHTVTVALAGCM